MISESKEKEIELLTNFINTNPDPREIKRALAVKLALLGYAYRAIKESLHHMPQHLATGRRTRHRRGVDI